MLLAAIDAAAPAAAGFQRGEAPLRINGGNYLFRSKIALLRSRIPRAPAQVNMFLVYSRRRYAFRLLHRTFRVTDNSRLTPQQLRKRTLSVCGRASTRKVRYQPGADSDGREKRKNAGFQRGGAPLIKNKNCFCVIFINSDKKITTF